MCCRLEVDLLMGSFAVKAVPSLSLEQLREYERILSCETVDLFSYVSGQKPVPEVRALPLMYKHV